MADVRMWSAMNDILSHLKSVNGPWLSIVIGEVNGLPVSARVMDNVEAKFHTHDNADELNFCTFRENFY